jgi:hypothetical protein
MDILATSRAGGTENIVIKGITLSRVLKDVGLGVPSFLFA